jgi:hypothetical protein
MINPACWSPRLPGDFAYLESRNYRWEVVYTDMEEFYARRLAREGHLDLMGGYKTFDEINTALDVMHATYPSITTAKFSIGQTLEGREIYCIKISDNPEVDENESNSSTTRSITRVNLPRWKCCSCSWTSSRLNTVSMRI